MYTDDVCQMCVSLRASSDVCLKLAQVIALTRDPRPSPARRETRPTLSELCSTRETRCARDCAVWPVAVPRARARAARETGVWLLCAVCAYGYARDGVSERKKHVEVLVHIHGTHAHTPCTARSGKLYEQEWGVSQHMGSAQMAWQVQYPSYRHGHRPARARHGLHTHCPGASRRLRASARARAACTPRET